MRTRFSLILTTAAIVIDAVSLPGCPALLSLFATPTPTPTTKVGTQPVGNAYQIPTTP